MSHIFRFFGAQTPEGLWILSDFEIEHARKVVKIRMGDELEVMDGKGSLAFGIVVESSREAVVVKPSTSSFHPPAQVKKALAIGALKPGDFDELLPGLIELGADEIFIFQQAETAKFRTAESAHVRWKRITVAAVKQAKRVWMPKITVCDSLLQAIESLTDYETKLVLDASAPQSLLEVAPKPTASAAVIVGGERGLSEAELNLCRSCGFMEVQLGSFILRAKTAALAAASLQALMKSH